MNNPVKKKDWRVNFILKNLRAACAENNRWLCIFTRVFTVIVRCAKTNVPTRAVTQINKKSTKISGVQVFCEEFDFFFRVLHF